MQKSSIRKISILGMVLAAALAVTAAIVPSKMGNNQLEDQIQGSLTQHSSSKNGGNDSSVTCAPLDAQDQNQNCLYSTAAGSSTSSIFGGSTTISSTAGGAGEGVGFGNTSDAS